MEKQKNVISIAEAAQMIADAKLYTIKSAKLLLRKPDRFPEIAREKVCGRYIVNADDVRTFIENQTSKIGTVSKN